MKTALDIKPYLKEPKFPHFAAGRRTQQLKANARKMRTCVQNGVRKRLPALLRLPILDQSKLRFKNPIPPNPEPMKLATAFSGATQQRNAKEPNIGKTYSGRNCQSVTAARTEKKTIICFLDVLVGCSLCFFCVSKRAV